MIAMCYPLVAYHYVSKNAILCDTCRETTDKDFLIKEFDKYGKVTGFKFFVRDRRMALIQMSSVSEAIEALIVSGHNLGHLSLLDQWTSFLAARKILVE